MHYHELKATAFLKQDIPYPETQEKISILINAAMNMDKELRNLHARKGYKKYVFNSLYPTSKSKKYEQGNVYRFKIRSMSELFIHKISHYIQKVKNEDFNIMTTEIRRIEQKFIGEMESITPVIITLNNQPWMPQNGMENALNRIQENLEKKYFSVFSQKINPDESFTEYVRILNHKPMKVYYKGINLLGHKFLFKIKQDEISQNLAFLGESLGIGEKNSAIGCGFTVVKYIR